MDKFIVIIKRNITYITGAIAGGVSGYLYWYFIGCDNDACPLTANPVRSIIWGAVFGSLVFSLLKKETKDE